MTYNVFSGTLNPTHSVFCFLCKTFYRSSNAIFGKVGRRASEEVILQLVKSKCMPMLMYGLECFALLKSDVEYIDFAVTRFLMKLFRTSSIDIMNNCR